jgi:AcrR family transcriptional regulator
MARPALTEGEIADFRERLCEVATRRFVEFGYAGVSLRGLALELGCSPTTPYRYFRDKDEIFAAVRARAFDRLARSAAPFAGSDGDPLAELEALGFAYLRFARDEPHAYRMAFELGQPEASAYPELLRSRHKAWQVIFRAVRRAIESGALAGDANVVSHIFWAGMHGLAALHLAGQLESLPVEKLQKPMVRALLRGALPSAGPATGDPLDA